MTMFVPPFRRFASLRKDQVFDTMDLDQSGSKTYKVNSIGYRGEEFRASAEKHCFVFGCSYTYGIGLNEDELWHSYLRAFYSRHIAVRPQDINLMNFGLGAASNREIALTTVVQCSVFKPDLVIVQFTHAERTAMIVADDLLPVGPWLLNDNANNLKPEESKAVLDFYSSYLAEQGAFDLIYNLSFVHHFLNSRGTRHLLVAAADSPKLTAPAMALLATVDSTRVIWLPRHLRRFTFQNGLNYRRQTRAADGKHPGPAVHYAAAEIIWKRLQQLALF